MPPWHHVSKDAIVPSMVKTFGLTHIALTVRDPERSLEFYRRVFGVVAVYRDRNFVQAQTPDSRDVLVFERGRGGRRGSGIKHFGFRLMKPSDIRRAINAVAEAGGTIQSHGEFCPGEPYVFFRDPDGYEVEIWYEIPTPVDPPVVRARKASARSRARAS